MMLELQKLNWQLYGWRPFMWQLCNSMELGHFFKADTGPVSAEVPGSVQAALLKAGLIEDPHVGLNSLLCEWVEHRHWEFAAELPPMKITPESKVELDAQGLDYSGWILLDYKIVGSFSGALRSHRFDLTPFLENERSCTLRIIFDAPPEEQGQAGFTSRTKYYKPRYNFGWDWCPRFIPIGISDSLVLRVNEPAIEVEKVSTHLHEDLASGNLTAWFQNSSDKTVSVCVELQDGHHAVAEIKTDIPPGRHQKTLDILNVTPWWPNGCHNEKRKAQVYQVRISHTPTSSASHLLYEAQVGFKQIRWLPCKNAPQDAQPWICQINGESIFLQGVNWTPVRIDYHNIPEEKYAHLIELYRKMGCNLLRVWGGAYLENETFYNLCDKAGLLVWQEFPLSSSGIDNWAPEDPESIQTLCDIARGYIRRRGHHVSKLLWCGGNELQSLAGQKTGIGVPLDNTHPALAALEKIVQEEDPGARFLPTSSSGPLFYAEEKDFGKGLHHDVHGPWTIEKNKGLEDWKHYWQQDDALFRSETGMPGASSLEILNRYRGKYSPWPVEQNNPYWRHTASWWIEADRFREQLKSLEEQQGLTRYVQLSQELQAAALRIAAESCKSRFPACGGFLVWMGHDCFPCPANTAVIDFEGNPKPAYYALQEVFAKPHSI